MPALLPLIPTNQQPSATPARPMRIALINMPWGLTNRPSIQCGLLKASLARHGHDVTVHYLNLELAAILGPDLYMAFTEIGSQRTIMLGEWLFTVAAFGDRTDPAAYHHEFPEIDEICAGIGLTFEDLCRLRADILPTWVRTVVGAIQWSEYDLVGFSSTFEQHVACLAAATVIKAQAPHVPVAVGGANVDGDMGPEYLRHFTDLDYVVVGEADHSLPMLAAALSWGQSALDVPGVWQRSHAGEVKGSTPSPVKDLDALPLPDYTDYFRALAATGREQVIGERRIRLLAEFSRGCWWGEKHHCTFCGLNALGMAYRSKSPARAVEEIVQLAGSTRLLSIDVVDNILDMRYISALCEELAPHGYHLSLFFEVKANLSTKQLGQLKSAGVTAIQPGIESLSTHVLKIMDKGTDLLTNVRLLRSAREHQVSVGWNILTGFPGETEADYRDQAALFPALHHLEPPGGVGDLWLERFSPYFMRPPATFRDIRPSRAYSIVYPFEELDHSKIAYFFEYAAEQRVPQAVRTELQTAVAQWRERWQPGRARPTLLYQRGPGWISTLDRRGRRLQETILDGWRAAAYLGCADAARTVPALTRRLAAEVPDPPAESGVQAFLDECVDRRLMVTERGRYLALAVASAR